MRAAGSDQRHAFEDRPHPQTGRNEVKDPWGICPRVAAGPGAPTGQAKAARFSPFVIGRRLIGRLE